MLLFRLYFFFVVARATKAYGRSSAYGKRVRVSVLEKGANEGGRLRGRFKDFAENVVLSRPQYLRVFRLGATSNLFEEFC